MQQTNAALLSAEDLTKTFYLRQGLTTTEFRAVDTASFTIDAQKPEIFTVVGESGSGKTTLARMILGMDDPSAGSLRYKGRAIAELSSKEKKEWFYKEIQPVFQDPFAAFSPLKRIDHYLYETALNYKVTDKKGVDEYLDGVLKEVGLSLAEIKGRYPNELSGGQAQRVAVARSLITRPSLIVADEPVSMLDASLRMSIVNMFRQLKESQGVTVIYITHDLATAYYAGDRIAVMLRGWVVEMGPVEKVLGNPQHPYTQNLKHSIPKVDPDDVWEEKVNLAVIETDEYTRTGCKFAGRCPMVMAICHKKVPRNYQYEGRMVKCFLFDESVSSG
ncbi:ABC transporter ATP-binding protein [Phototrophicus methaneseepsis]|uniref:ABC transporter ATP-binding protein n=1 Tax=Phototrophicus methaneseepsis TaxID=2710758 RepID=A0A7S8ECZ7_9CHLR|nr:ABC transporter ATP-binding protein [Phototrophicus methaneseepsis]QPC84681.1 ABC transporter ATP-binding protein [Phototrophicus methaneseepsis]